MLKLPQKLT